MIDDQPQIHVVSLGTALRVPDAARPVLSNAGLVIGAKRHLASVGCGAVPSCEYPSPIDGLTELLRRSKEQSIVMLASGDALFFGIGSWLLRHGYPNLHWYPNVTTLQSACARIGKAWKDVQCVSLHGRPTGYLRGQLAAGLSLAVYTDDDHSPTRIAQELVEVGFADSELVVCEALDSAEERVRRFQARQLLDCTYQFNPLNFVMIEVKGQGGLLPTFPGIPDAVFAADGDSLFTKREVRLTALSRLALGSGEIGWDIGAGSGGIGIEWARWSPRSTVYAIERDATRCQRFNANLARFGHHGNLTLIQGEAPQALEALPQPQSVYIGGSGGALDAVIDHAINALDSGGRLVAAAVTVESRTALQRKSWPGDVEFIDIAISHAAPVGRQTAMRSQLPVLLATYLKQ